MSRNTKADRIRADRDKLVEKRMEALKTVAEIDAQIRTIDGILALFVRPKKTTQQRELDEALNDRGR